MTRQRPLAHSWLCGLALVAACQTEVARAPDEGEANRIAATLSEDGIAADIRAAGNSGDAYYAVAVPAADGPRARIVLGQNELPAPPTDGLAEVFDRGGLIPTPTEEHARLVRALQGELAATFESLDGVVAARVHVSISGRRSAIAVAETAPPEPSASVVIRYSGEEPPLSERDVQRIVSGAVAGLRPEQVAVVALPQEGRADARHPQNLPLGPFSVSSASLAPLRLWLAVAASSVGLLGAAIVILTLRLRRLRKRLNGKESP